MYSSSYVNIMLRYVHFNFYFKIIPIKKIITDVLSVPCFNSSLSLKRKNVFSSYRKLKALLS